MKQTHTSSGWESKQSSPPSSRRPPQGPYPEAVLPGGRPRGASAPVQVGGVCVLMDAALVLMNSHLELLTHSLLLSLSCSWESSRLTLPYQRALALPLFFTVTDTLSSAFVDMLPSGCGRVPPWRDA